MGYVVVDDNLLELERGYRRALCGLTHKVRLIIELELLNEMKSRVTSAEVQFDKLGGQGRIDSIEYCISELDEMDGTNG